MDRTDSVLLRRIAHCRTGDKGDLSSISVIAWHPAFYPLLLEQLTESAIAQHFEHRRPSAVRRYALPRLHAMNVVLEGALDGGVNGALNLDGHGKALSFRMLEFPVTVPQELLPLLHGPRDAGDVDYAQAAALVSGDEGVFTIPEFAFESGERLCDMKVGYVTHGRLNARRDNAVLLLPGTANTRHSADGYIGEGNALDPTSDFVIAVDAIGAGTSSQPADGLRGAFPRYGIRDMVAAEHALVTQAFGLRGLKAVFGASMGAFQGLEWAIHHPDMVKRAVLLVPAWRAGPVFRMAVRSANEVIELDPRWRGGDYDEPPVAGLRAAGRLYYPWTVTDEHLEQMPPEALEREVVDTVARASQWDAWNFIRRYEASAGHDVTIPFGGSLRNALARVQAPTLVLPTSSDRLLGIESARQIARHVRQAEFHEVPSRRGHLGWRAVPGAPETRAIVEHTTRFLNADR